MLKVVIISGKNDLDFWKQQFAKGQLGQIDMSLHSNFDNQIADLVLLDFSGIASPKDRLLALSSKLAGRQIIIASDQKDVDLAIEAIKLGAIGFLVKPFQDSEFAPVLEKAKQIVEYKNANNKKSAKIITMLSYKGGTGVSTATVNLGYTISTAYGKKTLLIDGAGFSNHLTVLLNVPPKCTLSDVCQQGDSLDENYLHSAIKMVNPNLGIIGGLIKTEDLGQVHSHGITKLLSVASEIFDYIVIDTATHAIDEISLSFIQNAHELIVLTTFDLLTVKDNRFYIQALKDIGVDQNKIKAVINRQDWFIGSLEPELVQKQLNHPIYHALPNDWNLCVEAANYGRPVMDFAPGSQLAMSYRALAGNITGLEVNQPSKQTPGNPESKEQQKKQGNLFNWFQN